MCNTSVLDVRNSVALFGRREKNDQLKFKNNVYNFCSMLKKK